MKVMSIWKFLKESGICKTTPEAKNEIKQRSIKINGITMTETHYLLCDEVEGKFVALFDSATMPISDQEVKECDASKVEQGTNADNQKKQS